jgi:hypothetical protein
MGEKARMQYWAFVDTGPSFDRPQKVAENTKLLYANFFVYGMLTARNRTASFVSLHSPTRFPAASARSAFTHKARRTN